MHKKRIVMMVVAQAALTLSFAATAAQAQEQSPRLAEEHYRRAKSLAKHGEFDQAIGEFDKAIGINPRLAAAWTGRGQAYFLKGDIERAIADFETAIKLDPRQSDAYFGCG